MKSLKTLGFAAMASVVATIFFAAFGTGTASATVLCTPSNPAEETSPPCNPEEKEYDEGGLGLFFSLARGKAVFKSSAGNIECNESNGAGTTNGKGSPEGSLTSIDWTNSGSQKCPTTIFGASSAESEPLTLPWGVIAEWTSDNTEGQPNGSLTLTNVLADIAVNTVLGTKVCHYKADMEKTENYEAADEQVLGLLFNYDNSASGFAEVHIDEALLVKNPTDPSLCPKDGKFSAEYKVVGEGELEKLAVRQ